MQLQRLKLKQKKGEDSLFSHVGQKAEMWGGGGESGDSSSDFYLKNSMIEEKQSRILLVF